MLRRSLFRPLAPLRHLSTRQRQAAMAIGTAAGPLSRPAVSPQASHSEEEQLTSFLKKLTARDLILYTLLGTVTASPLLLKAAIKAMPYVPSPVIRTMVYPIYCGGVTTSDVRQTGRTLLDRGIGNMMLSYSVEDANGTASASELAASVAAINSTVEQVFVPHNEEAARLFSEGAISAPPASGYIALKPTGLMANSANILANYNNPEYAQQWKEYLDVCRTICQHAVDHGKGKVVIVFDAEKMWLQHGVYAAQREMMKEFNRDGKVIVCGTVQMYLQHSLSFLQSEIELAKQGGYQVAMKLVRGAYIHSEPHREQDIHLTKEASDASYNAGANLMFDYIVRGWHNPNQPQPVSRLVVASHNVESCDMIDARMRREAPAGFDFIKDESVVFGQLMGMNDPQSCDLADRGRKIVKYVPWGPAKETKEYLTRRLEENGDAARGGWNAVFGGLKEMSRRLVGR